MRWGLRPAQVEAPGWYFGDGDLAMPVASLLTWDITPMNLSLLAAKSYDAFFADVRLKEGKPTGYGLGVDVRVRNGHREIEHAGEVGGFVAENVVLPEDRIAIAVLTNQEASSAASQIAKAITPMLLPSLAAAGDEGSAGAQAKSILQGLAMGQINRALFTDDCNFYFSQEALDDFKSSLAPLGKITEVVQRAKQLRGGMTFRAFTVKFGAGENEKTVTLTTYTQADGKLEQFLIEP